MGQPNSRFIRFRSRVCVLPLLSYTPSARMNSESDFPRESTGALGLHGASVETQASKRRGKLP